MDAWIYEWMDGRKVEVTDRWMTEWRCGGEKGAFNP